MTKEAEEHAKEDETRKEETETRNRADALVYQAERALKDAGDKVPSDVKSEVEEKAKALKDIQATGPLDEVKTKTDELSTVLSKIGESMYKQGPVPNADGQTPETPDEKAKAADSDQVQEGEVVKE